MLCAYLRMPYTPPMPHDPATAGAEHARLASPADNKGDRDAAQELQVRQTAQRLLADHLRPHPVANIEDALKFRSPPQETYWPGVSLDLTRATLVDLDLSGVSIVQAAFDEAIFTGAASFRRATFSGDASFSGATFADGVSFYWAVFSATAAFNGATFFYNGELLSDADFSGATFYGWAEFWSTKFLNGAVFYYASFSGAPMFQKTIFSKGARIEETTAMDYAFSEVQVLHLDDPELNQPGERAKRVWPDGWSVLPDADDPTRGTLVRSA